MMLTKFGKKCWEYDGSAARCDARLNIGIWPKLEVLYYRLFPGGVWGGVKEERDEGYALLDGILPLESTYMRESSENNFCTGGGSEMRANPENLTPRSAYGVLEVNWLLPRAIPST